MASSSVNTKQAKASSYWARPGRTAARTLASVSYCPHPDAVRRRQEAEAMRQQRSREHSEAQMLQAMGLKWWEGSLPANMVAVTTPRELDMLSRQAYAAGRGVLINYFQEDCYACRCLHKKLKQLAEDHPEVLFLKVNGSNEALRPVFAERGITKVPFFQCARDGELQKPFSASLDPEKLKNLREQLSALARSSAMVNA
ncbi:thioredoxin [Volvox carteri f. nagariensis]|uniref:Thioredoxin n=1 Tax=Volvox carteri f. nagariensis TaxID=3068 RepID=D8TIR1_VOLCA|nr:thioredoxin [Volvox carteri f. nagariensis]EFJ52933.1 thioredoxin [Volvox carteri f. nagariensis]|eukprot:XP_002945938.1 thioredoxin [Volvox carteri f. nagariensis]